MKKALFSLVLTLTIASAAFAGVPMLSGDYIEVRSNHIMAGGCTYSAEAVYDGNRAVMAWRITEGELANLSVVAVILGEGNLQLGDHARETALFVDANATPAQQQTLADAFTSRYGDVFGTINTVQVAEINFSQTGDDAFRITIPGEVQVITRTMVDTDHEYSCDPQVWYGAFAGDTPVRLVQTARNAYSGKALKSNWKTVNKRSAYIGKFSFVENLAVR